MLLRLTEYKNLAEHLLINPPARVSHRPILQRENTPNKLWSRLLWQEEVKKQRMIYPMRIPVEFDDEVRWNPKITWDTLADLKLRGSDSASLEARHSGGSSAHATSSRLLSGQQICQHDSSERCVTG